MKPSYYLLLILSLSCYFQVNACGDPSVSYRVACDQAHLIVGIELKSFNEKQEKYPIHTLIKGTGEQTYIEGEQVRYAHEIGYNMESPIRYMLLFLKKQASGTYLLLGDKDVLRFGSTESAQFAVNRIQKLVEIQQIGNREVEDHLSFDWLIEGLSFYDDDYLEPEVVYRYDDVWPHFRAHDFYLDAISNLLDWSEDYDYKLEAYNKKYDLWDEPWGNWVRVTTVETDTGTKERYHNIVHEYEMGGDLSKITEKQKEQVLQVFEEMALPDLYFIILLKRLELTTFYAHLFEVLYQCIETNKSYEVNKYIEEIAKLSLSKQEQDYLAKLTLYHLKANSEPALLKGQQLVAKGKLRPYLYKQAKTLKWLASYIDVSELTTLAALYQQSETDFGSSLPDVESLSAFIKEAEQHLDMCGDPRISKLTGKQKLWDCFDASAFAQVEAFTEGSIQTNVYPNPNRGNFQVNIRLEKAAEVKVSLQSLAGTTINTQELAPESDDLHFYFQHAFQVEELPSGMYLLIIQQQNKVMTEKVIISK